MCYLLIKGLQPFKIYLMLISHKGWYNFSGKRLTKPCYCSCLFHTMLTWNMSFPLNDSVDRASEQSLVWAAFIIWPLTVWISDIILQTKYKYNVFSNTAVLLMNSVACSSFYYASNTQTQSGYAQLGFSYTGTVTHFSCGKKSIFSTSPTLPAL